MSFQSCPTFDQPLSQGGKTQTVWYRFFQGIYQGIPPAAEVTIAVGASPFSYQASQKGFMIVRGGSVSAVQFTRTVTTLTGQTAGLFPLSAGDILTVTYSGLPTMIWVPQ